MLTEFSVTTLLILIPLITGGISWFDWELNKSNCAFQSYAQARRELISKNVTVSFPIEIGGMSEKVTLVPLEALDSGPKGLAFSDLSKEVSQLSEDASRSYRRLRELDSTKSSSTLKL